VVFADKFTPKAEQDRAAREGDAPGVVPFLKRFTVFNVDQCEGLETLAAAPAPLPERQIIPHVEALIAATRADLIINTTRRSYHLQMRASSRAYLSQVAWRYPQAPNLAPAVPVKPVVLLSPPAPPAPVTFNLGYRIKGEAHWRPARVYDDGARTYVEFGPAIALSDLPPLYGLGPDGKTSELINYRLEGRRLVVDRLFDRAELRFGLKRWERRVRIERTAPAREAAQ
jgi:type IV secretion system protein VirB9